MKVAKIQRVMWNISVMIATSYTVWATKEKAYGTLVCVQFEDDPKYDKVVGK